MTGGKEVETNQEVQPDRVSQPKATVHWLTPSVPGFKDEYYWRSMRHLTRVNERSYNATAACSLLTDISRHMQPHESKEMAPAVTSPTAPYLTESELILAWRHLRCQQTSVAEKRSFS